MSFAPIIAKIKSVLETDPYLKAFCKETWTKELNVRLAFKKRQEIPMKDLPVVLVTSPNVGKREEKASGREAWRRVRLYAGFYQKDMGRGVLEQILFEELIDAALAKDTSLGETALDMRFLDSANDEGIYQPAWFTVIDIEVLYSREWTDLDGLGDFLELHAGYDLAAPDEQIEAEDHMEVPQ